MQGLTTPTNGTEQLITAKVNNILWSTSTVQPGGSGSGSGSGSRKKGAKKMKEAHEDTVAPATIVEAGSGNPLIGPPENSDKGRAVSGKKNKATTESLEDLDTEKKDCGLWGCSKCSHDSEF